MRRGCALVKDFQTFATRSTERQFRCRRCCKTGWGSALSTRPPGEEIYRDWTIRVGDYYLATQHADGH